MNQETFEPDEYFIELLEENHPDAYANILGSAENPTLQGTVKFYSAGDGTLVEAIIFGLPHDTLHSSRFYGFHIHENGNCTQPFDQTGNHYNPTNMPHPDYAGDMPPLLGNQGFAYSIFYTDRFTVKDITGRSVIIHASPDDFTTQPSGNSGIKIGCGVIQKNQSP